MNATPITLDNKNGFSKQSKTELRAFFIQNWLIQN